MDILVAFTLFTIALLIAGVSPRVKVLGKFRGCGALPLCLA